MRTLLILLLLLAGCASAPPLELRAYWQPQDALQWEHSRVEGAALDLNDGTQHFLEPQVVENLVSVHSRLLKASGRRWLDLGIADARVDGQPVFYAFASTALGGPMVGVSIGLLDLIGRDAGALAAVLAHEMAHVALGHSPDKLRAREERLQKSQQVGGVPTTGSAALAALVVSVGAQAYFQSLTRDEERAADERGMQWAVKAGFDPCGMARALDAVRERWSVKLPFFSSHPGSEERRALADRYSREATGRECPRPGAANPAQASVVGTPAAPQDPVARPVVQEQQSAALERYEAARAAWQSGKHDEALRELRALADGGFARAQARLGYCYLYGCTGVTKDEAASAKWLRLAADQGNAWAQVMLGRMYLRGRGGVEKDERKAVQLFRLSAEQGQPYGEFNVGLAYLYGLGGVEKDPLQAARYFYRAAQKGDASAQASLGRIYRDGITAGIPKNEEHAAELFRLSAEQDHPSGQVGLAEMYYFGSGGLQKDRAESLRLFRLAAEQGNANAQHDLGEMHEAGEGGLQKDVEQAVLWYRRAAAQGHQGAIRSLRRLERAE